MKKRICWSAIGVLCFIPWYFHAWSQVRQPLHGPVQGCATVLRTPMRDNYGNGQALAKLGKTYVLLQGKIVTELVAGNRFCARGNAKPLDGFTARIWQPQHVRAIVTINAIEIWKTDQPFYAIPRAFRELWTVSTEHMRPDDAALFRGIVFGDNSAQSDEEKTRFRISGFSHITAVSGENVAFVLLVVIAGVGLPRTPIRGAIAIGALLFFAGITEWQPSVLRAVVMASIAIAFSVYGQPISARRALLGGVIALVVIDPLLIGRASFCLSVGACIGVLWCTDAVRNTFGIGESPLATTFCAGIAAQLGIVVPMVTFLHRLPPLSAMLFVVIEPIVALLMILGVSWGIVSGLIAPIGTSYVVVAGLGVRCIRVVASFGASWPTWLQTGGWVFVAALAIATEYHRRRGRNLAHFSYQRR